MQRREHAGVSAPEITEVEVTGVLTTEHRVRLGHGCLDKGMADARAHRGAAVLEDDLGHGLRGNHVVNDRGARRLLQLARRDQGGQGRWADELAALVNKEAAIGVTVEGQPNVGTDLEDALLQVDQVRGLNRIRLMIREGAIELEVQGVDIKR